MQSLTDDVGKKKKKEREREKGEEKWKERGGEERNRPIFIEARAVPRSVLSFPGDRPTDPTIAQHFFPHLLLLTGWMAEFSPWIRSRPIEPRYAAATLIGASTHSHRVVVGWQSNRLLNERFVYTKWTRMKRRSRFFWHRAPPPTKRIHSPFNNSG